MVHESSRIYGAVWGGSAATIILLDRWCFPRMRWNELKNGYTVACAEQEAFNGQAGQAR
jgi:hypothetical protein